MFEAWTRDIMEAINDAEKSYDNEWDDLFAESEEDYQFD